MEQWLETRSVSTKRGKKEHGKEHMHMILEEWKGSIKLVSHYRVGNRSDNFLPARAFLKKAKRFLKAAPAALVTA